MSRLTYIVQISSVLLMLAALYLMFAHYRRGDSYLFIGFNFLVFCTNGLLFVVQGQLRKLRQTLGLS